MITKVICLKNYGAFIKGNQYDVEFSPNLFNSSVGYMIKDNEGEIHYSRFLTSVHFVESIEHRNKQLERIGL